MMLQLHDSILEQGYTPPLSTQKYLLLETGLHGTDEITGSDLKARTEYTLATTL